MIKVHWAIKIAVKIVLTRLPLGYRVWQKIGLFKHGAMDSSDYAIRVFNERAEKAAVLGQLQGKRVLELGPGDSIATALICYVNGAEAILVDAGSFASDDLRVLQGVANCLRGQGGEPPKIETGMGLTDVLALCEAQYLTSGLGSLKLIPDKSIDYIFSQAVLEHIRMDEFFETMNECRRILKDGGVCSHQVDLRDHLGGALNNLRFENWLWESRLFSTSGFYTNRIRFRRMVEFIEQAGFEVEVSSIQRWPTLPTPRNKLSHEFSSLSDEELLISQFDLILR